MQKFWPENINATYKSHRALFMTLIDEKNFNDMFNLCDQLEIIFEKFASKIPESGLREALILLNEKVGKLKESTSYKNRIIANQALDDLDNFYFEKAE